MLKSKFSLLPKDEDEDEKAEPEEPVAEETPTHVDVQVEEVEEFQERPLQKSEVSVRLSWLGKTADGGGYTYLKATLTGLKLTSIHAIKCFKNLQFVNLSDNFLTLDALQEVTELPFLLLLQADRNKIKTAALKRCKYLQVIVMNGNQLRSVEDVYQPELSTLEVGFNYIDEIKFKNRMPTLRVLDFRNNIIHSIADIDFPNLDSLYLANNKIKDLVGIDKLQNLRVLHVRGNPIRYLNGMDTPLAKLEYLNLRNTKVGTLRQIRKLKVHPVLETLILKGTFYFGGAGKESPEAAEEEEDPELRVEVIATIPKLKRLNKIIITPEERVEAKDLLQQWLEEGDKEEDEEVDEEMMGEGDYTEADP